MKRIILAILLALWIALTLLPQAAQASECHEISVEVADGENHGWVELYAHQAAEGETVWLVAKPEAGYVARIDGFNTGDQETLVTYAGLGYYAVTVPDGDVELEVRFVPAEGALYPVTGTVNNPLWGELTIRRGEAREGEWVVVTAAPRPGFVLERLSAMGTDGLPVKGGYVETREGLQIFEYCLPNAGVVLEAEFALDTADTGWCMGPLREQIHRLLQWVEILRVSALCG